jgi:hypothetical protein
MTGEQRIETTRKTATDDLNGPIQVASIAVALTGIYGLAATFNGEFATWNSPSTYLAAAAVGIVAFIAAFILQPKMNWTSFDRTRSISLAGLASVLLLFVFGVAHAKAGEALLRAEMKAELEKAVKENADSQLAVSTLEQQIASNTEKQAKLDAGRTEAEKAGAAAIAALNDQYKALVTDTSKLTSELEGAKDDARKSNARLDKAEAAAKAAAGGKVSDSAVPEPTPRPVPDDPSGKEPGKDPSGKEPGKDNEQSPPDRLMPFEQMIKGMPFGDLIFAVLKIILPSLGTSVEDRDLPALASSISTMVKDGNILSPTILLGLLKDREHPEKLAARLQESLRKFLADPANREKIGETEAKKLEKALSQPRNTPTPKTQLRSRGDEKISS